MPEFDKTENQSRTIKIMLYCQTFQTRQTQGEVMKILVVGAGGRLGSRLVKVLEPQHEVVGVGSGEINIMDFENTRRTLHQEQPELIINTAAWTDVDGCAQQPEQAIRINGLGAQNVAVIAHELNAAIMQISSNEVFDGKRNTPYHEYDVLNPVNPYGYSKYVGEQSVQRVNPRHYIVRTAWLFAHGGKNFVQSILQAAQAGKSLRVVVDEVANPTYNDDLAIALGKLINTRRYGIYHLTNSGVASRYAFARYVLDQAGMSSVPIATITRHQWPRPSMPPAYTPLTNMAAQSIGITLRPWQEAVTAFLKKEGLLGQSKA